MMTSNVTTFAGTAGQPGSDDGIGSAARFNRPTGVMVDSPKVCLVRSDALTTG